MTSYIDIGSSLVIATSDKAVKVRQGESLEDLEEHWIPFSLVCPEDLAGLVVGRHLQPLRVETWFVRKEGIA